MDNPASTLNPLQSLDAYRQRLGDAAFWQPYVQAVCQRHTLEPAQPVRSGLPGTYPTMIAGNRWVVKFFGDLFDGPAVFKIEQEASRLLAHSPSIPAPALRAVGRLDDSCHAWRYLVYDYVPGVSIGEIYPQLSTVDRQRMAQGLGQIIRQLHEIPLASSKLFVDSWDSYLGLLQRQRFECVEKLRRRSALPEHLLAQVEDFLLPNEVLLTEAKPPHLIHADLTRDHLLGRIEAGRWRTLSLIDFGDAMVGSLYYELAALHCDLFLGDRRLLRHFLDAYTTDIHQDQLFARKALSTTLLHKFANFILGELGKKMPELNSVETLDEFASLLWDCSG